jgi:O-antigen/teichoic acid export membrane protein
MDSQESYKREDFVQNSYILMIGYLLSSFISSLGTIIVIRLISVEENSFINIAYIIPAILTDFGELGLNYASIYFIAKNMKENNLKGVRDVIRINLTIKIIIGLLFTIFVSLFSVFISTELYRINDERMILLIQIASIGIISTILYDTINSFFLGAQFVKIVQFGTIMRTSLRSILSIGFILIGLSLYGPMLGFVLSPLIVVIIYLVPLKMKFRLNIAKKEGIEWSKLKDMIKYGYPLTIFSLLWGIQYQLYFFIPTLFGYITEVSYLNVAVIGGSIVGILTKSITFTLFPIFSKMEWNNEGRDRRKLIEYFQFSIKFATLIIIPVTIFTIFFAEYIFPIIFGDSYINASPFISTYFLIFLLVSFGSLSIPAFFNGQRQTKYVLYIQLIELFSIVMFSIILMPLIGAIGMAWSIVLGSIISVIFGNILIRKEYGNVLFKNFKNVITILLIAAITGFLTFLLFNNIIISEEPLILITKLLLSFIFYAFIFLLSLGLLAQISIEEIEFFEKSFSKFPIINKIIPIISNIEKKIIKIRTIKKE